MKTLLLFIISSLLITPLVTASIIEFTPETITLDEEEIQLFQINCTPSKPIKSWEVSLEYNPLALELINVTEGNFFAGYNTFFTIHDINNDNGTATIYSLIVGAGNVTNEGTLLNLTFKTKTLSGTYNINITDFGITNETQYLNCTYNNVTITIREAETIELPKIDFNLTNDFLLNTKDYTNDTSFTIPKIFETSHFIFWTKVETIDSVIVYGIKDFTFTKAEIKYSNNQLTIKNLKLFDTVIIIPNPGFFANSEWWYNLLN